MERAERRTGHEHAMTTGARPSGFEEVVASLRRLCASEIALYLKTKAAHWTVFGPLFREVHLLLDDIAAISVKAIDDAAERAAQLGGTPPLGLTDVGALSIVKDRSAPALSNRAALEELLRDVEGVVGLYREIVHLADGVKDAATASMLSSTVEKHEKQAWFVRRTLEGARDLP